MAREKHWYLPALAVAALVLTAFVLRFAGTWLPSTLARSVIYLGLFATWGVSVSRRVVQSQQRRQFMAIAALMVFWMAARTVKYLLPDSHPVGRYCWYLYYIPMLFIPLLTALMAAQLGRGEGYRLPRWTRWLFGAAALIALLVLTNDAHRWVFVFPGDMEHYVDGIYRYGPGFLLPAVWRYGLLLTTLALVFLRSRLPHRGHRMLAPIVPSVLLVLYHLIYLLEFPWLRDIFGDLTVTECLLVISMLEACLRTGLIPSNTRYAELFSAADLSAWIVDEDNAVHYASRGAAPLPETVMRQTETGPVMLNGGIQLRGMDVPGGRVLWATDLSALLRLQDELKSIKDELTERNEALRHEYEEEQKYRRVMEQNRLYDALQAETQSQINAIDALAREYRRTGDAGEKRRILTRIILLGSFVKRRKDFVLSANITPLLPDSKLQNALAESYRALGLMGIEGTCGVDTGRELVKGEILTAAYDLFEQFVETALGSLKSVSVTVGPVNGALRVRIFADCTSDLSALQARWPRLELTADEDGVTAILVLEGGGAGE